MNVKETITNIKDIKEIILLVVNHTMSVKDSIANIKEIILKDRLLTAIAVPLSGYSIFRFGVATGEFWYWITRT